MAKPALTYSRDSATALKAGRAGDPLGALVVQKVESGQGGRKYPGQY